MGPEPLRDERGVFRKWRERGREIRISYSTPSETCLAFSSDRVRVYTTRDGGLTRSAEAKTRAVR